MVPQCTGDGRDRRPADGRTQAKGESPTGGTDAVYKLSDLGGYCADVTAVPAQAQWRGYVSRDLEISFHAPGDMITERGTYSGDRTGDHPTIVYRSAANNIEYKVVVTDFRERADEGASLAIEAAFTFQDEKNVLMDAYARIHETFDRKVTIDLPDNGGRSMGHSISTKAIFIRPLPRCCPRMGITARPLWDGS